MDPNKVAEMILQGKSHKEISNEYKRLFPAKKGFSERSVRRYCQKHSLHKPKGTDLDSIVEKSVTEVCIIMPVLSNYYSVAVFAIARARPTLLFSSFDAGRTRIWMKNA